jgi:hypothetical protein
MVEFADWGGEEKKSAGNGSLREPLPGRSSPVRHLQDQT